MNRVVAAPGPGRRALAFVRVGHPFPSLLNAVAVGVIAILAGGGGSEAVRIGVSMFLLQFSIGAVNDLADRDSDSLTDRPKPIARGLVEPRAATALVGLAIVGGLGLAATFGPSVVVVAVAGVGLGNLHNLVTRGTVLAWLPLVLAVPLVPVFGWLAGAGSLPPGLVILVPAAGLAGAALAIANTLADLERDRETGRVTLATRLGSRTGWRVGAILWAVTITIAIGGLAAIEALGGSREAVGLVLAGAAIIATGTFLALGGGPSRRQKAWEVQAIGAAVLGAGWIAAIASA